MIQIISNIKKLFQRHKPDAHVPVSNDHGTRCILHVANLALFGVVVMLTIASTLIYFLVPITKVSKLNKMVDAQKVETDLDTESTQLPVQKVETGQDAESAHLPGMFSIDANSTTADPEKNGEIGSEAFSVINERNMFSQNRKEWVVRAVIPKSNLKNKKNVKKQRALAGKPKKIILHGVIIAGNMKKALINNPLKGVSKKKTLYIQEGDELEGYKVTSIEKDRITLDWHGEEIVIMLYSGLNDVKQDGNTRKAKQGSTTLFDYKFKVVENIQTEKSFDDETIEVANNNVPDGNPLYLVHKEPESFAMQAIGYSHSSETVETQEGLAELVVKSSVVEDAEVEISFDEEVVTIANKDVPDKKQLNLVYKESESFSMPLFEYSHLSKPAETEKIFASLPDVESNNEGFSNKEQDTLEIEEPESVDLVAEEGLKNESLSGKTSEILLNGIVIVEARDVKKALVNIPMSHSNKGRTLSVEEGDSFEGYKVKRIESDRLRLDRYGEEFVLTAYSGLKHFKQGGNEENVKQVNLAKLDTKSNVVEDAEIEISFDEEVITVANKDVPDKKQLNLVYKDSEYFSMPAFEYSHLSKAAETEEVVASLPDVESNNVRFSNKEQETLEIEESGSIDLVAEEGLKQEPLSGKPLEILLNGIVIVEARDVKKALINIPMSHSNKGRTLSVEEGDSFDGYKVTSIEPERIRLDRQGEEFVLTDYSGLKHFSQGDNTRKTKQVGLAKLDTKLKVIEDVKVDEGFDQVVVTVEQEDVHDESSLSIEYKEPEYLSMASFKDSELSAMDETQENDIIFPFCSFPD